ncbi:Hypothetical predicted protein [Lecanosticta acicola]|uniref:Uncharacterized protein n=1 Tax=Lecanosticta acicola TaxID=111012 RepID=A0AAI8Z2I0_9PEZI|nr:Hypothetical predicted protein [Lecanosticta acicola]
MDWTGGTRRRYANRGKASQAVVQRQWAHFARARAKNQSQAPSIPDFMQDALASKQSQPLVTSSHHPAFNSHDRAPESHGKMPRSERSSRLHQTRDDRKGRVDAPISSRHQPSAVSQHTQPDPVAGRDFPPQLTEEEQLLLANRRRLLARDDWLGLAASRPAKFRFPSHRDKDRIGKRRKIDKPRLNQTEHTAPPPPPSPFRERHRPFGALMSGALQQEDINVEIGTGAFDSQTQYTRPSALPANTSMRRPSTDVLALSEQSMLMDVDDHGFAIENDEAEVKCSNTGDGIFAQDPWAHQATSLYTQTQEDVFDYEYQANDYRGHRPDNLNGADPRDQYDWNETPGLPPQHHEAPSEGGSEGVIAVTKLPQSAHAEREQHQERSEDEDDQVFQRLEQYGQSGYENTSMVPLQSSALRLPPSGVLSGLSQLTGRRAMPDSGAQLHNAPDNGHGARDDAPFESASEELLDDREHHFQESAPSHPNASASQSAQDVPAGSGELFKYYDSTTNDEELWKAFVLGDTESEVSESARAKSVWEENDTISPLEETSSQETVKEDICSDKATVGNSVFHYRDRSSGHASSTDLAQGHGASTRRRLGTSMIGHAATAHYEDEDIQGIGNLPSDEARSLTSGNIHASSALTADPKRFSKPKNKHHPPPHSATRFLPLKRYVS